MNPAASEIGTLAWVERTQGRLSPTERRSLLLPLARTHAVNAAGRMAMLARVNSGRRTHIAPGRLSPPASVLTRAAEDEAQRRLTPALLNHSYRTYVFATALGVVEGVEADDELLFAAAMLHDVGLTEQMGDADFTLASARVARDVAETVGLSTAASETMQTAITMHHSPRVTRADGPVAYLLSAGAGVDVVGLRSWAIPPVVLATTVENHPRLAFKREFVAAVSNEAARVPQGRMRLLERYGAFHLAIQLAPFRS